MKNVITAANVHKEYDGLTAVRDIGFEAEDSRCYCFLGPNGAGKTTLMKMIYGRVMRNRGKGTIKVFGMDPATDALSIKYLCGVMPQDDNLDVELTVLQNLFVYSRFYAMPRKTAARRIDKLLDFMELSDRKSSMIRELSGGMKRRLLIARALLNNPRLLILDEPTTGLDPQVRHLIWDKLIQLKRSGTSILLTTHYMEEAFRVADKVLIMHRGSRMAEGSPRGLIAGSIENHVLEIRDSALLDMISTKVAGGARIEKLSETAFIYSDEIELLQKAAAGLNAEAYFLRPSNLEDVFLKLTGRGLDE